MCVGADIFYLKWKNIYITKLMIYIYIYINLTSRTCYVFGANFFSALGGNNGTIGAAPPVNSRGYWLVPFSDMIL